MNYIEDLDVTDDSMKVFPGLSKTFIQLHISSLSQSVLYAVSVQTAEMILNRIITGCTKHTNL